MMNHMKKLFLALILFVFTGSIALWAQTKVITGNVSSAEEGSIPGVTVVVKGTTVGAITDAQGNYTITVPANANTLVFSYIGLKTHEVAIAGQSVVNAVLEPDLVGLSEVVVTALGITREKKSLGYATQSVTGEAVSTVKSDNFVNSLSGKDGGVDIRT